MSYYAYSFAPDEVHQALDYIHTTTGAQQLIHILGTWTPAELRIVLKIKQSFRRQYSKKIQTTEMDELLFGVWRLREHRNYYITASITERIKQERATDAQRTHRRKHKTLAQKIIACKTDIDRLLAQGYDYPTIAAILKKVHEKMFTKCKIDPNYLGRVYRAEKNRLVLCQSIR